MTKQEFLSQMAKVMENLEAKEAMEKAATAEEAVEAAALAGVTLTEKDLQEAAAWTETEGEVDDLGLDRVAAGVGLGVGTGHYWRWPRSKKPSAAALQEIPVDFYKKIKLELALAEK